MKDKGVRGGERQRGERKDTQNQDMQKIQIKWTARLTEGCLTTPRLQQRAWRAYSPYSLRPDVNHFTRGVEWSAL